MINTKWSGITYTKVMISDQKDPFKNRRCMAWISYRTIIITLVACLLIIVFGNEGVSDRAESLSEIIISILACLTLQIGDYSHSVRKKDDADSSKP